jgi:hypothetical protein
VETDDVDRTSDFGNNTSVAALTYEISIRDHEKFPLPI